MIRPQRILVCAGLAFWLAGCSGGSDNGVSSGLTCSEVCSDAAKCSKPPDAKSCKPKCDGERGIWNQSAWDAYTACLTAPSCQSLDDCMKEAAAAGPESSVDRFLGKVCSWAVRCAGGAISQSQCTSMLSNVGKKDSGKADSSPWDFVRLLRSSTLDCVAGCVQGASCSTTDYGGLSGACAKKCGLGDLLGSSSSSSSSSKPSCEMQHGNCGDHGKITQNQYGGCECQCDKGYVSSSYVCVAGCDLTGCGDHGSCESNGVCTCDEGYYALPDGPDGGCALRPYFVQFSTAEENTCAVRNDGALECWGSMSNGLTGLPDPNSGFVQVELGGSIASTQACALRDDASVACWAGIQAPSVELRSLSLGGDAACGVAPDDSVHCWGFSPFGANSPPDSAGFREVAMGDQLTCGVRLDGTLSCWGTSDVVARVPKGLSDVAQVSLYSGSGCVRHGDGSLACFGTASYVGMAVPDPNSGFIDVACGELHVCGLHDDGTAVCWGNDVFFNGGLNPPAGMADFTDLDVGSEHSCGLRKDGSVACWGSNNYGQALPSRSAKVY